MTNGEKIKEVFPQANIKMPTIFETKVKVIIDLDCEVKFPIEWWDAEYKEPTTQNDLVQERYQDLIEYFYGKEVAKTILEDRKEFKAWLERLRWNVKRADELARELEHIKGTTKNDLGVDCVDRQEVDRLACRYLKEPTDDHVAFYEEFFDLPSVTPIRIKGHWISHGEHCENLGVMPSGLGAYEWCSNCDCGIDSKNFSRVNYNYCPNCGADMREVEKCKD